jgi:TPR repeat protein
MRRALLSLALLAAACGKPAVPAAPAGSAEAPAAAGGPSLRATSLVRSVTPQERLDRDEKRCETGEVAGCRKVADRYRGYGRIAGCGVAREGPEPRRMVTSADAPGDAKQFDRWIRRACDLGDGEACLEGRSNVASSRFSEQAADACSRSALADCPLYLWAAGMHPTFVPPGGGTGAARLIETEREKFLSAPFGGQLFVELYRREKTRGGDTLPPEVEALAERICKTTLECDDVFMMLDKNGYGPAALAPLRKTTGEALARACLEGSCVCGEAARFLDPEDQRVLDLARIGCDDGEPEACFMLGDLHERGAGVEKDLAAATRLYQAACPSVLASDDREERYSKAACDRLAGMYEEGRLFDEDIQRAYFYSTLACTRRGFERDQAPCLRRARFHAQHDFVDREHVTNTSRQAAREFFYGIDSDPVNGKECERPSVAALCQRDAKLVQ